jgi:hypothetical protein
MQRRRRLWSAEAAEMAVGEPVSAMVSPRRPPREIRPPPSFPVDELSHLPSCSFPCLVRPPPVFWPRGGTAHRRPPPVPRDLLPTSCRGILLHSSFNSRFCQLLPLVYIGSCLTRAARRHGGADGLPWTDASPRLGWCLHCQLWGPCTTRCYHVRRLCDLILESYSIFAL